MAVLLSRVYARGDLVSLILPEHSGAFVREKGGWGKYHQWLEKSGIARFNKTIESLIRIPRKKIGRNKPCPCNSGKKYKKCCASK